MCLQTGIPLREAEPLLLFSILFTLFTAINPGAHRAVLPCVCNLSLLMACLCLFDRSVYCTNACTLYKVCEAHA